MYYNIIKSFMSGYYWLVLGRRITSPMEAITIDFMTAEEIGQLMGGN